MLLVVCTSIVTMVPKHVNTMLISVQVYSLHSKHFCAVSEQRMRNESQRLSKTALNMGQVKEWGGGGEESFLPRPLSFFGSLSISHVAKTENPVPHRSLVVLCSEPTRKHLLHRLASVFTSVLIQSVNSDKNNEHKRPLKLPFYFKTPFDKLLQKCPSLQSGAPEFKPRSSNSLS